MEDEKKQHAMFLQLVMTFQNAAAIQMGKVENPQTGKKERHLAQAQYSIDMLDMIKEKTQGNLTEEESKILNNVLTNLKMSYLEESENEKKSKKDDQAKSEQEKGSEDQSKKENESKDK